MFHFLFQGLNAHTNSKHKYLLDRFECTECDKSYLQRHSLNAHMKYHSEKKFVCDICNKTFYERQQLKRHLIKHTGVKAWKCHLCMTEMQMVYYFRDGLKKHLKKIHDSAISSIELNYKP